MPEAVADLLAEIASLREQLESSQVRLKEATKHQETSSLVEGEEIGGLHALMLAADSALPLGSFAFSSGLESHLAHIPKAQHTQETFSRFLHVSLASVASTTLPYVASAYECPERLETLDNDLDASTACAVVKRASVKQGRALLTIWERSFRSHHHNRVAAASQALEKFVSLAKVSATKASSYSLINILEPAFHFAPLFGCFCHSLGIPLLRSLYLYLLNHAKAVVSAGIRAGIIGPYQAQSVLADSTLQLHLQTLLRRPCCASGASTTTDVSSSNEVFPTELAGQCIPVLDLWAGRHEILYSRIFNS